MAELETPTNEQAPSNPAAQENEAPQDVEASAEATPSQAQGLLAAAKDKRRALASQEVAESGEVNKKELHVEFDEDSHAEAPGSEFAPRRYAAFFALIGYCSMLVVGIARDDSIIHSIQEAFFWGTAFGVLGLFIGKVTLELVREMQVEKEERATQLNKIPHELSSEKLIERLELLAGRFSSDEINRYRKMRKRLSGKASS